MFAFFIFPFRFGVWTRNVLVPSLGSDLGQRTSQARIALPLFALHIPYFTYFSVRCFLTYLVLRRICRRQRVITYPGLSRHF